MVRHYMRFLLFILAVMMMFGGCKPQLTDTTVTKTTTTTTGFGTVTITEQMAVVESATQSTTQNASDRHEIGDGAGNEIDVGWFEEGGKTTAVNKSESTTKTTVKKEFQTVTSTRTTQSTASTQATHSTYPSSSQAMVSTGTTTTKALEGSGSGSGFGDLV